MTVVTMTSTVDELTSGQQYRVRAKTAERLVQTSKATIAHTVRKVAASKEGKKGA